MPRDPRQNAPAASVGAEGELEALRQRCARLEAELEAGRRELMHLLDRLPLPINAYDDERGVFTFWNRECERLSGYGAPEILGSPDAMRLLYPDPAYLRAQMERLRAPDGRYNSFEWTLTARDGSRRTIVWSNFNDVADLPGHRLWGVGVDITDRAVAASSAQAASLAKDALRENSIKYQEILSILPIGIIVTDEEGRVVECNPAASRLMAQSETDMERIDNPGWRIVDGEGRLLSIEEYAGVQALRHNRVVTGVERGVVRDDGSIAWMAVTAAPLPLPGHGVVVAHMDVTSRKKAEQELIRSRQRLRELSMHLERAREQERTRIARELHDEFSQALTALSLDVAWLQGALSDARPDLLPRLKGMHQLIMATSGTVQRISQELRPRLLDDLGLTAALEWLADEFVKPAGIRCTVTVISPGQDDASLPPEVATAIFRIAQEALTNVVRHSSAATVAVEVAIGASGVSLCVADDGVGMRHEHAPRQAGFGLLGIRERVAYLDGRIRVAAAPGNGVRLEVQIPLA